MGSIQIVTSGSRSTNGSRPARTRTRHPLRSSTASPAPPSAPPVQLRVYALGDLAVWRGDQALPATFWRGDKACNVFLALLSAPGHRLNRVQVSDLLWPEEELRNTSNSLREVLSKLRKRLRGADDALPTNLYVGNQGAQWLGLVPESVWIDADAFAEAAGSALKGADLSACQTALDLYRGDYLAGQSTDSLHRHAAQIRGKRGTLRRLYGEVLARAGFLCEAGDPQTAAGYYRRVLALNPAGEEPARRSMALLARLGELNAAQEVFATLTRALARQGLAPSPETVAVHDRLLAAGLALSDTAAAVGPEASLQTVLAVGADGDAPPILAVIRANQGVPLIPADPAGPRLFTFANPASALEASWTLMAPTGGSAIPRGLRLALHTRVMGRDEGARPRPFSLAALLASRAHGGQVLVSHATHAVVGPSLPASALLIPLDRYDLIPGWPPEMVYQLTRAQSPVIFPPLKLPLHRPHNLPAVLTPYIERPRLETQLSLLLAPSNDQAPRLLTLIGVGGGGKTRLALQLARDLLPHFPGGAWLVELAALTSERDLIAAVGKALGLREDRERPFPEVVVAYLRERERPILLVVDNCEHLLGPCARLIATLLRTGSHVRVLATSRERLGMQGERVEEVPPLTTPPAGPAGLRLGDITRSEAVRLFCERAQDVVPGFTLNGETAAPIALICRRLDGIPLAIELAAAQLAWRPLAAIAGDLDDFPTLLAGGNAGAPERHQTLRAALDWSYCLLDGPTRVLFRRLSVFAGGCTLPAAESVCAGSDLPVGEVAILLRTLVTASLVRSYKWRKHERYRMLEPVRQYALEWLGRCASA